MSRTRTLLMAALLAGGSLGAPAAFADKPAKPPAEKPAAPPTDEPGPPMAHPKYDPATVENLQGEVVEVKRVVPKMPMMAKRFGHGIHVMLKTDKETIEVHLGPAPYVEKQDVKIAAKDRLEVKGSRVTVDGKQVILAEQVKKGDKVLVLREADGTPRWRGEMGHGGPGGPPAR